MVIFFIHNDYLRGNMGNSLQEIGIKYNTDKAWSRINSKNEKVYGHNYLKYYELFLQTIREHKFTLVELGCYTGASLKMWKEYFPHANIIGVDLNKDLKKLEEERISFICSDATASDLPQKITKNDKNIECIIDDCSHAWGDQRRTFEMLFPILADGGYYIIEDLECGSMGAYPDYPPQVLDAQPFWEYMVDRARYLRVSRRRHPEQNRPYFDQLPPHIQEIEKSIDMVVIVPGAIIIRKESAERAKQSCQII